jgi:threonine/homoserine/homoserine lactone efflux protein
MITPSLLAFSVAAALLTVTPGLDTALVLRTAAVEGPKPAMHAGAGIVCGVLAWGLLTALGLGAVLAISETAYLVLQIAGAAYLFYLGGHLLWAALAEPLPSSSAGTTSRAWFARGVLTNLLNPKVGVFYVSFLPQFIPAGAEVITFSMLLASIHGAMGLVWFAALVLATRPLAHWLRQPTVVRALNGLTGAALIAFGLRLAVSRPGS